MSSFEHNTTYFWNEGKANLDDCLRISFEAAKIQQISKIVIFTGVGQGVRAAVDDFRSQEQYKHISIVAVTFPHGHPHPKDISEEDLRWMSANSIPLVRAHLPFDPIRAQYKGHGILGQDYSLIGNIVSIFGGGMSLAIQAILMACDAGHVGKGEHVISLTADTSILARSAPSSHLLTDFIVREVFCKPVLMDISKKELLPNLAISEPEEVLQSESPKLIEGS
jgi:hypothetical protein